MIKVPMWGKEVADPLLKILSAQFSNDAESKKIVSRELKKVYPAFSSGDAKDLTPDFSYLEDAFVKDLQLDQTKLTRFVSGTGASRATLIPNFVERLAITTGHAVERAIKYRPPVVQEGTVATLLTPLLLRVNKYIEYFSNSHPDVQMAAAPFALLASAPLDAPQMVQRLSKFRSALSSRGGNMSQEVNARLIIAFAFLLEMQILDNMFITAVLSSNNPWLFDGFELLATMARENGVQEKKDQSPGYQKIFVNSIHSDLKKVASGVISFNADWARDALPLEAASYTVRPGEGAKDDSDLPRLVSALPWIGQWSVAMSEMWRSSNLAAYKLTSSLTAPFAPISSLPTRWFYWPQKGVLYKSFLETEDLWNVTRIANATGVKHNVMRSFLLNGIPPDYKYKYNRFVYSADTSYLTQVRLINTKIDNLDIARKMIDDVISIAIPSIALSYLVSGVAPNLVESRSLDGAIQRSVIKLVCEEQKRFLMLVSTILSTMRKKEGSSEISSNFSGDLVDLIIHFK